MYLHGRRNEPFGHYARFTVFAQDSADAGAGDLLGLGQVGETHAACSITEQGLAIDVQALAPDATAFEPCASHAGPLLFDNKVPLQLSDRTDDDDESTAERAMRSKAQTMTMSKRPRRASARS